MNTTSLLPANFDLDSAHDPLMNATLALERCARLLDLEGWVVERLRHCEQETTINFLMSEGDRAHPATGIVVRHCSAAGRVVVPIQVSRDCYRNSVCAEAMRISWLCALFGLRYGGGAGALIVDPAKHNERELRRGLTVFAESAKEVLSSAGVLFPSGLHAVEMDWLEAGLGDHLEGHPVVAGRASVRTPSYVNELAAGLAELIRCAAGGWKQRIAVQGFDEDVRALVSYLHQKGGRLVAVADPSGGIRHELGLDPQLLEEHVSGHGALLGYPDGEAVLNADVLQADCDVLILAGGERQITTQNAAGIRARVILEPTAGAVADGVAQQLCDRGTLLVSDLLCAGPAVLRAVAEAEQIGAGARRMAWIRRCVRETWRNVLEAAQRWKLPAHQAATVLAVQRVAAILRAQGTSF